MDSAAQGRRADVNEDELFDEDYLYFYEERTNDERSDAETELIWRLLRLEPGMTVLDVPCGHGRIANRLAAQGCEVTGLDSASLFLDRARLDATTRGVSVNYVQGDMRDLPWVHQFDRVVNWFGSFGYFADAGNKRMLADAYRALRPGGKLLIDISQYIWLARNYHPSMVRQRNGDLIIDRGHIDPLTNRSVIDRTVIRNGRTRRIPFFIRLFTFTELQDWLLEAGFTEVTAFGEDGTPLTPDHQRMIVVATRSAAEAPF